MGTAPIPDSELSGKQREILQRDALFLRVAEELLLEDGYHALTMARVAERTRFSKGTVYTRFTCKEELVVALGCRCSEERLNLLERAAKLEGRTRERLVALGEAAEHFARLYPNSVRVLHLIDAEAILEKVPEALRQQMRRYGARLFELMLNLAQEAVACGDLRLPPRSTPEELCFALCALVDGGAALVLAGVTTHAPGLTDPFGAIGRGCHLLLDGCGWQPLARDFNYSDSARRIRETLFAGDGS
jgi:AcrR family transcriptional regulator